MRCFSCVIVLTVGLVGQAVCPAVADESLAGDPYLLPYDPVSGQALADVAKPVVVEDLGRELRFVDQAAADRLLADPDAYLPAVDAAMTAQQLPAYPVTTCPISGAKLGSMGEPIDVVEGNRLVRLCCAGCTKAFEEEPAPTIARLDAAVVKAQAPLYDGGRCPVSGEALGSMGAPKDLVMGNRLVRLCCAGCVHSFTGNPQKYWANLPELPSGEADAQPADAKPVHHDHADHDH